MPPRTSTNIVHINTHVTRSANCITFDYIPDVDLISMNELKVYINRNSQFLDSFKTDIILANIIINTKTGDYTGHMDYKVRDNIITFKPVTLLFPCKVELCSLSIELLSTNKATNITYRGLFEMAAHIDIEMAASCHNHDYNARDIYSTDLLLSARYLVKSERYIV